MPNDTIEVSVNLSEGSERRMPVVAHSFRYPSRGVRIAPHGRTEFVALTGSPKRPPALLDEECRVAIGPSGS